MTPWELVKKSEHSHQRAVFAWANCAARYGFQAANDPRAYTVNGRREIIGGLGGIRPTPIPDLARLFAVHNQGHGNAIRGAMARAEGVKAGVPDMFWPKPRGTYKGLWIELKRPSQAGVSRGRESDAQADWRGWLEHQGYCCCVCVGWQKAVGAIQLYWSLGNAQ